MSAMGLGLSLRRPGSLARFIMIVNFVLLLALIGPGTSHSLELALRRAGIADLITLSVQVWFIGSTILASVLFTRAFAKKSIVDLEKTSRPTKLDWVLLLTWWVILFFLCLYAFMMGFGG